MEGQRGFLTTLLSLQSAVCVEPTLAKAGLLREAALREGAGHPVRHCPAPLLGPGLPSSPALLGWALQPLLQAWPLLSPAWKAGEDRVRRRLPSLRFPSSFPSTHRREETGPACCCLASWSLSVTPPPHAEGQVQTPSCARLGSMRRSAAPTQREQGEAGRAGGLGSWMASPC